MRTIGEIDPARLQHVFKAQRANRVALKQSAATDRIVRSPDVGL
jgi:hypothetical protein